MKIEITKIMKYHLIYYLNKLKDEITIRNQYYPTQDDAIANLERVALDYVKNEQGVQQLDVCRQYEKTPEQIRLDVNLKDGFYLKRVDNTIQVYKKQTAILPGRIWSSFETEIIYQGVFKVSEIEMDLDIKTEKTGQKFSVKNKIAYQFLDELKGRLENKDIKLRPIMPRIPKSIPQIPPPPPVMPDFLKNNTNVFGYYEEEESFGEEL